MTLNKHLLNASAYAEFFEVLINGGGTAKDFTEESGLGANTVRKLLAVMKRKKLIHVSSWEKDTMGRHCVAAYSLGNKPDAKRPPWMPEQERRSSYLVRMRRLAAQYKIPVSKTRIKVVKELIHDRSHGLR
jgi:predicted ArsR family transcriptional regulator